MAHDSLPSTEWDVNSAWTQHNKALTQGYLELWARQLGRTFAASRIDIH